jgi:hypothetical protein
MMAQKFASQTYTITQEDHLDKAGNRREMLEEAAMWMDGGTHAKILLTCFEEQMEKLETFQKSQLDDFYDTEKGYESLKANIAPYMFTQKENMFVLKVRVSARELYELLVKADDVLAEELLEKNDVWKGVLSTDAPEGFATAFIELMATWNKVNP